MRHNDRVNMFIHAVKNVKYVAGQPQFPITGDCQDLVAWYYHYVCGEENLERLITNEMMIKLLSTLNQGLPQLSNPILIEIDPATRTNGLFWHETHLTQYSAYAVWFAGDAAETAAKRHMMIVFPYSPVGIVRSNDYSPWLCLDLSPSGLYYGPFLPRLQLHIGALHANVSSWASINHRQVIPSASPKNAPVCVFCPLSSRYSHSNGRLQ